MPSRLTNKEKGFIVKTFYAKKNKYEVQRLFKKEYGRKIKYETVSRVVRKFDAIGVANDERRQGRPLTVRSAEGMQQIVASTSRQPMLSSRQRAAMLGIDRRSLRRANRELGIEHSHPRSCQALAPSDMEVRVQFACWWRRQARRDADLPHKVAWTDECSIRLRSGGPAHNTVWYGVGQPPADFRRQGIKTVDKRALLVWAAVTWVGLIGPFFIEGTVTAASYLKLLQQKVMPALRVHGIEWFMQDGAPAHTAKMVRKFLDAKHPEKWIGKFGPVTWPPRSPDLTPCDFWLWGDLKRKLYAINPPAKNLAELRERVEMIMGEMSADEALLRRVCGSVSQRMLEVIQQDGAQLLHRSH